MPQAPYTPNLPTDALQGFTAPDEDGERLNLGQKAARSLRVVLCKPDGTPYVAGGGGSSVEVQVNGVDTADQTLINFTDTPSVTWANPSGGNIEATASGSGGGVTDVTATAPILSSGGATPDISIPQADTNTDGYLSQTDWDTFNNKQPAGAYLTGVTADAPLSGAGTSGSHLLMAKSTTSVDGYLAATDFVVFNNKQAAGNYLVDPGANGLTARTALNTTAARTITGTANRLSVSNGDGASGNPTLNVPDSAQLNVAKLVNLTSNGFVKTGSGDGSLSVDTATYLTAAGAVTSINKTGSTALVGAVTLTGGSNVTLTQSGQDISIASTGGSGSPGGSNTQVQYNNSSAFGGISGVTSDGTAITFASGDLKLSGSSSGTTVVTPAATGGGTLTLFAGNDTVVGKATTDTFTNKTYDTEGIGNVFSMPMKIWLPAAGNNAGTAGTIWDLPSSNAPTVGAIGTTTPIGCLTFPDASSVSAYIQILLPPDWTSMGGIDIDLIWRTAATSGNVQWFVNTSFSAVNATALLPNASYNAAQNVITAAPGTTLFIQTSTISALTLTGSTSQQMMWFAISLSRIPSGGSDTLSADVNFLGAMLTYRRAI